ncbi:MAG: hypothetical protein JWO52_1654 [Gammaproteobacteria bacterium]|nr:hypothetical protein [Gammaproteobacteria bacterium]
MKRCRDAVNHDQDRYVVSKMSDAKKRFSEEQCRLKRTD